MRGEFKIIKELENSRKHLYRAVNYDEWLDISASGKFRSHPGTMEGKWFAENLEDAAEWGRRFYQQDAKPFYIVEIDIPISISIQLYRIPNLDSIGPARWAGEGAELDLINNNCIVRGIEILIPIPIRFNTEDNDES